jgi:DNA polymerase III sliding clamp (beta) subunit (PCNA family)
MKIQDLRLALTAAPKKTDIRYYLNGVKVTKDTVSASNGHILCHISAGDSFNVIPDQLDNNGLQIPDSYLIIPVETVKDFIKKVGTKSDEQTCCVKLTDCDGLTFHVLSGAGVQCLFTPIDGKYPSFDKILTPVKENNHDENLNSIKHQFDWAYVALANDAICKYYGNTTPKRLYSCIECGYFMPSLDNDIIYVIMPCRN